MASGVDLASSVSPAAARELHRLGVRFVMRYVSTPGNPKNLGRTEAAGLLAADLQIGLVFETLPDRCLGGQANGEEDAASAKAQAAAVGAPGSTAIYFGVDFDIQPAETGLLVAYLHGVTSVLGKDRSGCYGGLRAVVTAAAHVDYLWQARAWSGTPPVWDPRAQLRQPLNDQNRAGLTVDLDESVHPEWGQWAPPNHHRYKWRVRGDHLAIIGHCDRRVPWIVRHPRTWQRQRLRSGFERLRHHR